MGSGTQIIRAIRKYGLQNFKKEYLAVFDNPKEMLEMESQLVDDRFTKRFDTYNIVKGGGSTVGFITVKDKEGRIFLTSITDPKYIIGELVPHTKGRVCTKEQKQRMREGQLKKLEELGIPYFGYGNRTFKHSEKTKVKIRNTLKLIEHNKGAKNHTYSKTSVTDMLLQKSYNVDNSALEEELKKPNIVKGRINIPKYTKQTQLRFIYILQKEKKRKEYLESRVALFTDLYKKYIESDFTSIESFVQAGNYNKTYNCLVSYWKRYIPGYPECCKVDKKNLRVRPVSSIVS